MWNMMCDVMPTISEDSISQRSSQFSGEDANFEQLMVSMLDERDKLMDSLREAQERLSESEMKLQEAEKERDSLHRQINANLPQVSVIHLKFEDIAKYILLNKHESRYIYTYMYYNINVLLK
ncbi:liprin-alpha-2-like [Condylostylus longicornis]|uniref:liprin-alpha-2-like n=1 Tax=Condylostylus longicornis TaxID=2530218 RepID=UPI00244E4991|nr:liprin-alpha-2-like [Condylostylus longicornis]XP_055372146.1 liprin-alpha-2-like [Condylostylus longicornis]